MNEYRLAIVIDANGRPAIEAINKVTGASRTLEGAQRGAAGGADRLAQSSKRTEGELQSLGSTARRVQGFLAAVFGAAVVREIINTTTRIDGMKRTLEGVLGSGQAAAAGIAFIRSEADRLGVAFQPALDGYTKLAAAARGTELAPKINELTGAILQAGSAFNLSGDQIGGAIQAIEQMISKGTVSAEELRGQLGERIPGAFGLAAKAMGVTTAELSKMLEQGQVVATDFLPKFAAELQRSTAAAAALNSASPSAELERIKNELEGIATDIGGGIFEGLGDGLKEFKEQLAGIDAENLGRDLGVALGTVAQALGLAAQAIGPLVRNIDGLMVLAVAFAGGRGIGAAVSALKLLRVELAADVLWAAWSGGARGAALAADAFGGRLVALAGGPIVVAVAGLALLALEVKKNWDAIIAAEQRGATSVAMARGSIGSGLSGRSRPIENIEGDVGRLSALMDRDRGREQALARHRASLEALQRQYLLAGGSVEQWNKLLERSSSAASKTRAESGRFAQAMIALNGVASEAGLVQAKQAKSANELAAQLKKLADIEKANPAAAGEVRKVREQIIAAYQKEVGGIGRVKEALASKATKTKEATAAEKEAKRAADELASANDRLAAAIAGLEDPLRNVADAQRNFTQLQADLFRELGGPRAQIIAQYQEDLRIIQEYLASVYAQGPITPDQARQVEDQVRRARENAARARDEDLRQVARNAGTDFEEVFRRAFEDGINGASLQSFWQTITDGFKRAIEEGGAQGALNFVAGATDMLSQAVGTYRQAGGGARGVSAAVATMNIPVVSQVASVLNSINSLFGGRVFGTDWATQSASRQFSIGSSGNTSGSYSERQSRQRSLFRGTARRTQSTALQGDELNAINELMRSAQQALAGAARAVGAEVPALLAFGFRQEFDSKGNLIRETATIAGQQFSESLEQAAQRYIGANILAILQGIDPELAALGARFESTGAEVLDFAQAMLLAQSDISRGSGLIAGATVSQIGAAIDSLRAPGESLVEAYGRVTASTQLYLSALGIMDGAMQTSTAEVVAFAAGAVDAMGGLDAAAQQLNVILGEFFTDAERAAFRLQDAQSRAARAQTDLGVDGVDAGNFRSRFEAARAAGLTPEQFAQWVRLGVALADGAAAARQLAEATGQVVDSVGDVVATVTAGAVDMSDATDRALEAFVSLRDFTAQLGADISSLGREGMNDFVSGVQDVEDWIRQSIDEANRLARAAGFQAASTETLTQIQLLGAARLGQAIMALDNATVDLITSLYSSANVAAEFDINRSNDPLAFAQQLLNGINQTVSSIDPQRYQQALQIAQNLFNLGWATGDDPLNIAERMGLPFDRFITDLGVDLTQLNDVSNFDGLVQAARALGVELPDLAARVGVSLGQLSDAGSLLNNGFERLLGGLTEAQRSPIEALLRRLETAPTSDRAGITEQLSRLVNSLPAELRSQFAPYLNDVDVTPPEQEQIEATDRVSTAVTAGNTLLGQILTAIERGRPPEKPIPGAPTGPLRGEKSADGSTDWRPVTVAIDVSSSRQVTELQAIVRGVRSVEGAITYSNQLLQEIANESRRAGEQVSIRGLKRA